MIGEPLISVAVTYARDVTLRIVAAVNADIVEPPDVSYHAPNTTLSPNSIVDVSPDM